MACVVLERAFYVPTPELQNAARRYAVSMIDSAMIREPIGFKGMR